MARAQWGEGWAVPSPDNRRADEPGDLSIRQSRGLPTPLTSRRKATIAAVALLVAMAGCGDEGVAEGATVAVYASAPLCAEAERELERSGQPESVRVQVVCLAEAEDRGGLDLATIGANARRAVEDSRTVAYIGEPTPAATRFSETILDSAEIAQLSVISGATAMSQVLRAIERSDSSSSPRESVHDELG